jgi:NAD(P)-dependent dehydrogenase (short-subunit alcohol dehydrogenase family)
LWNVPEENLMPGDLHGKTALVTGASRGIGRATAERLAASGAIVGVHYAKNTKAAAEALSSIEAKGGQAFLIQAEFGRPGAIDKVVSELEAELLRRTGDAGLDILINNAGGGGYATVPETTEESYDRTFDLNTRTPFFLTQKLLPRLRSGGSVINISSEATRLHLVNTVAYSMAKSALEDFTICLAKEIGPRGIRVNAVKPGVIHTAQSDDYLSIPEKKKEVEESTALRRVGQPEDMAAFLYALVSQPGAFVTGQVIELSGGYLL